MKGGGISPNFPRWHSSGSIQSRFNMLLGGRKRGKKQGGKANFSNNYSTTVQNALYYASVDAGTIGCDFFVALVAAKAR